MTAPSGSPSPHHAMNDTLLFTHIPKTAGTSLRKSVINPNVRAGKAYNPKGYRRLLKDRPRDLDVMFGHFPYGIHRVLRWFSERPFRYVTFLREPLDHAVSYYYYVLQCETYHHGHPAGHGHPALADAKRYPIEEFYAIEEHRNMQTKFTAGFEWYRGRNALPAPLADLLLPEGRMLRTAERNLLDRYWFFGLFERLEESQDLMAEGLGWKNIKTKDETKVTRNRPRVEDLTEAQRASIRRSNALDFALYDFACEHFDTQRAVVALTR